MIHFTVEPHNYYLKTTVGQGILGLTLLLTMLLTPIRIFYSGLARKTPPEIKTISLMGVGVIICYLDFMMSNTTLDVQLMTLFMAFILLPLLGGFSYEIKKLKHEA
jgi:O-antigen ligase